MATPDAAMTPLVPNPSSHPNAVSLETGAPALYALVADTTSEGHAWLPSIMPDGRYLATPVDVKSPVDAKSKGDDEESASSADGNSGTSRVTAMFKLIVVITLQHFIFG